MGRGAPSIELGTPPMKPKSDRTKSTSGTEGVSTYTEIGSVSSSGSRTSASLQSLESRSSLKDREIDFKDLQLGKELGKGSYGFVFLGKWRNQLVAVKRLNVTEDVTQSQLDDFNAEAVLMLKIRPHKNVVTFLAICTDPLCIVTDYYKKGNFISYLKANGNSVTDLQVITIMKGVAAGMVHLHQENVIHRDLSARNILISETMEPAVADFGFARVVAAQSESGKTVSVIGPIRWMAPESLQSSTYSKKTDVWAFGVTTWEGCTRGKLPFAELETVAAGIAVVQGKRLQPPKNCPPKLEQLMTSCWKNDANDRPSMQELFELLEQIEGSMVA